MLVKEIMTYHVETIDAKASVSQAAAKMRDMAVGALPVWENNEITGIVTDRDIIVRSTAEGKDPQKSTVGEIMTPGDYYVFDDDNVTEAARVMEKESVHRLLVLNHDGDAVGIISFADMAVKCPNHELVWELVERKSEPARPHRV